MQIPTPRTHQVLKLAATLVALMALLVGSAWLMRYWTLLYVLFASFLVLGLGYPVFAYFRKHGKGLIFLMAVSAILGGGGLGLYWDELMFRGDGPNSSFKPNPLRGSA